MLNFTKQVYAAAGGTGVDISSMDSPVKALIPNNADLGKLFSQPLLRFVFVAVGLVFMFNLVMAGWDLMLSSGDPKKVATATTRVTNGFMGIIISMTAYVVVKIILTFLGLGTII